MKGLIAELDEFQAELWQALRRLNSQPAGSSSTPVAREVPTKTAKLLDPEKYNGPLDNKDVVDLENWLAKIRQKL